MYVPFEESATCQTALFKNRRLTFEASIFLCLFNLNLSTALSDPWLCVSTHLGWRGTQQPWLPALCTMYM